LVKPLKKEKIPEAPAAAPAGSVNKVLHSWGKQSGVKLLGEERCGGTRTRWFCQKSPLLLGEEQSKAKQSDVKHF